MRKSIMFLLSLVGGVAAMAQVRGTNRLQGVVTDKSTGKPVVGATVTISLPNGSTTPIVTKSDSKGRWSALGLTGGQWNVDIVAAGYETTKGSISVSTGQMVPPIHSELAPEAQQETTTTTTQVQTTSPKVPKEAVDAVTEAQSLLKINVGDVMPQADGSSKQATSADVKANAATAAADLEKALPQIPTDSPDLATVHSQVQQLLAQAYYRSGDLPKSIGILETLNQSDPWTTPDANQLGRSLL